MYRCCCQNGHTANGGIQPAGYSWEHGRTPDLCLCDSNADICSSEQSRGQKGLIMEILNSILNDA